MKPILRSVATATVLAQMLAGAGCQHVERYIHNGFKVGPNYCPPAAPVKDHWIDSADRRVRSDTDDLSDWWTVFGDPLLNRFMRDAYTQNLTLRQAGFRILQARAIRGIAGGNFFPQQQNADGSYRRSVSNLNFFDSWDFGFNLSWELDFWGRYRRAITSADDALEASVLDYDDVLVTLLGDVAVNYTVIRTSQERIRLLSEIILIQEDVLDFIKGRLQAGAVTDLDRAQAESNLEQSRAQIETLKIDLRTSQNQLCVLMGMSPQDLSTILASAPNTNIPKAPEFIVAGIPADLLSRRPDVRRAERLAAAQAEQIGIAETDWYPAITINGTIGWQANNFSDLFRPRAMNASVGPSFQWNLLNYGRILNNVRLQDATLQELLVQYQSTVLQADLEVENGITIYLQSHERARHLETSVDNAYVALRVVVSQYEAGLQGVDFNRYATILQQLINQQDSWIQSRGQIAQGLIQVYRALGGGWQIRCQPVVDKRGTLSAFPEGKPEDAEATEMPLQAGPNPLLVPTDAAPLPAAAKPAEEAGEKVDPAVDAIKGAWQRRNAAIQNSSLSNAD